MSFVFGQETLSSSPHNINPSSGSTTSSSPDHWLKEFADELALITFPLRNDDLPFYIESDLKEIEYLLNHDPTKGMDSILEDSIDVRILQKSQEKIQKPNKNETRERIEYTKAGNYQEKSTLVNLGQLTPSKYPKQP
uniref:Reverse transcriptase domain-containing protein n=1 Tax=Tanacetum cinerariifolium TaxID=118510 RepID=A0A6L2ML02_TANCI|nr:hypothetical protein [Tanacetum cinerariifolium]